MVSLENLTNPLLLYAADDSHSDEDTTVMELLDSGIKISNWKSYEFSTDYTDACSGWSFELGDESYQRLQNLGYVVQNGAKIALSVNGSIQATGYVDQIHIKSSRSGGTSMTITGRDALSPACDTCVNPNPVSMFQKLSTLGDLIRKVFEPFGFKAILVDDTLNRKKLATSVQQRSQINSAPSVAAKVTAGATVDQPINAKFKPHNGEGCYEFAERIAKRFGFHITCSSDGTNLFATSPDFDSAPFYSLIHKTGKDGAGNNVISSDVTYDWHQQPSAIIAEGHGGGGHFNKKIARVLMVNELLSESDDQVPLIKKLKSDFPSAKVLERRPQVKKPPQVKTVTKFAKPLYLYDDESKELKHLINYTRRIMAEHQSKFLTAHYTVNRHSYKGNIWSINTSVEVKDDVSGINQTLWIKARKFVKDRSGGTRTELTCILPHTYELFNEDK